MALLRLMTIALVACRAATAEPDPATTTPGATAAAAPPAAAVPGAVVTAIHGAAPTGWVHLPTMAAAVATAVGTDGAASSIAIDAWGEPAAGCYAVWLELRGTAGDAPALADQVLSGMTGITIGDLVRPTALAEELSFSFARPPYRGRLRAHLGLGRITAAACFGNEREPVACDTSCTRVLHDVR
jgi:hypothetical protein